MDQDLFPKKIHKKPLVSKKMFSVADRQGNVDQNNCEVGFTSFKRAAAATETHAENNKCWGGIGALVHCWRGCETATLERFGGSPES